MNKHIGDRFESKFVEMLVKNGWWCHIFAYRIEGQPCDVIAIRNNVPMLIDVKHCSESRFNFNNIRPNQRTCFELAQRRGVKYCGFAIYFEKVQEWRWLSYNDVCKMEREGYKSVREIDCWREQWN